MHELGFEKRHGEEEKNQESHVGCQAHELKKGGKENFRSIQVAKFSISAFESTICVLFI